MAGLPVLFNSLALASAREAYPPEPLPSRVDVVIVGAGVIGLSIGWRLARRGLSVAIVDAGPAGGGTSAAATGMLAASAEHEPGGGPLLELARESLALWPELRRDVEAESGLSIAYRDEGTLIVAVGRDEVERLRFRHKMQRDACLDARWLSGSAVLELEPGLRPNIAGGILCPGDHQVDPRSTLQALRAAFLGQGGHLAEATSVERLEMEGGRVAGIVTSAGLCRSETVVVASGAAIASGGLLPAEIHVPVRPLKGQSMALRNRPAFGRVAALPVDHVIWTSEIHIAPKLDGRMIVGATVEEAGFDASVTAGGLYALLEGVRRVLPGAEDMAVEAVWAGFRPTSDDDAPILGDTVVRGLILAAGHHRNGYLLAPVTARAIEDLVLAGVIRGAAAGFGLGRFEGAGTRDGA